MTTENSPGFDATPIAAQPDAKPASQAHANFGWVLFAIALGLIGWAFSMDSTVSVSALGDPIFDLGTEPLQRVHNNGLMNLKLMLCITGAGFLTAGSIFICKA